MSEQLDNNQLVKIYKSKYASLSNIRANMIPMWTDIRNFLAPRTARFPGEQVNSGVRQDTNIINSSGRFAIRTLAAGMQSGVTSPMRPWFRLSVPDPALQEFAPVKEWLYIVETRMRDVFNRSNIYDRLKSNYSILGTYGTSALGIDEDDEDVLRAKDMPMGSFMISTSNQGRVTTLYRDVQMNAEQMIQEIAAGDMKVAKEKLPQSVMSAYDKGNYDFLYPLCHVIEPNRNFVIGSALTEKKQYASVWFDPGMGAQAGIAQSGGAILKYKGYDELPMMCPRWDVLGEDMWGFGCGELALGDNKQMQLMEKRKLQGIDKNANPPKIADASLRNQRVSSMPGDTTYVNGLITGKPGVMPMYQVNPYITELREEIQNVSARVDEAFYKNLFLMVSEIADQPNITATQINTMREEKLLMLGPVLERLNDELLDPLISRVFNLMFRRGFFPPPPKEIQGQPLKVEYVSVLAQAQKAMGIGNIERFVGFVGQIAQAQAAAMMQPTAFDKLKVDDLIDAYADGVAIPPTIVASNEEANATRQARSQQQQAAQAAQMGTQAVDATKTLSETDMSGDNALTRLITQMKGGQGATPASQ